MPAAHQLHRAGFIRLCGTPYAPISLCLLLSHLHTPRWWWRLAVRPFVGFPYGHSWPFLYDILHEAMSSIAWSWSNVLSGVYKIRAPCYKRSLMALCFPVLCCAGPISAHTHVGSSPIVGPLGGGGVRSWLFIFIFIPSVSDRIQALFFFALRNLSRLDVGAPLFSLWIFDTHTGVGHPHSQF
jgi:hypothetical protein